MFKWLAERRAGTWRKRYETIAKAMIADDRAYPHTPAGDRCFRQDQRFLAENMLQVVAHGPSIEQQHLKRRRWNAE